jgi:aspartate-semialdehyde dehydrogenase
MEDGYTKEEWKMVAETKKMLDPKIKVTATCVRVPVFIGHSEAVNLEFERRNHRRRGARHPARSAGRAGHRQARKRRLHHADRKRRRRRNLCLAHPRGRHVENGLNMWIVSDNLRKGAALNAVQIAELMIERGLIQPKKKAA